MNDTMIQLALDTHDLEFAKKVAFYAAESGFDIIEVGTPMIKRYGAGVVADIKRLISGRAKVLADLKILDASSLEIESAVLNGAEIVTVMGLAYDETLREALENARSYNIEIWADLMYIDDPYERSRRLIDLGFDTVILHIGVDVQKRRRVSADMLEREVEKISSEGLRVAVAGGLDPYKALKVVERGASIIIMGGWIIRSDKWQERIAEAFNVLKRGSKWR